MAATQHSSPDFRVGEWLIQPRLSRIEGNRETVHVTPRAMAVLVYLAEKKGAVVSRNELLDAIWPRMAVTHDALSQCLVELRKAFDDDPKNPKVIETIPKVGVRLIAPISAVQPARPEEPSSEAPNDVRVPRAKHLAGRKLPYSVAGALLLTVAFIAVNSYLRGTATHYPATASSASRASEPPITFVVHAPEGSTFGMIVALPAPALSPDGKQLAFVAPLPTDLRTFNSNNFLELNVVWTQTVGNPDSARPLIGTNGAIGPFWSPDGRYIAFIAQGRLKRIAATGDGSPLDIAVADGSPIFGGTWSADGTIVRAGPGGLYRVPSDGGGAEPLTRIDKTRGEFSHRFPVMLPDEGRFVYLVLSRQDEYGGLYLGSIDDPDMKIRLMPADSNAAFGLDSSGRLNVLFVRDSNLVAQPFDSSRGAMIGDPVVIAGPIDRAPTALAAFAVSGRTLVYRPRFAPSTRLVWIDRGGIPGQQINEEGRSWRFPSLSPDGTRLVALREDGSDTSGLWAFDLRRGGSERLAPGLWVSERPEGAVMSAWMPDSNRVVYSLAGSGPGGWGLYWRPVTGTAESLFAGPTPPPLKHVRDVTDDFVLFRDEQNEFWVLPFVGERQPYRLPIAGEKNHGRVSPDGRWLAYDLTEAGMTEVYVTAFPEPADQWRISTGGGSDPQRGRGGGELYYIAADQTLMAVSVATGTMFDAGAPEPLFRASFDRISLAFGSAYAPAPDGQRFVVAEAIGENEPHLIATLHWGPQL